MPGPVTSTYELVGRHDELALVDGALADTLRGAGRVVLLHGDPGIGKTRIAQEFVPTARARGARVLIGRCHEGDGAPAYWPWVQILRSLVREDASAELTPEIRRLIAEAQTLGRESREIVRVLAAEGRLGEAESGARGTIVPSLVTPPGQEGGSMSSQGPRLDLAQRPELEVPAGRSLMLGILEEAVRILIGGVGPQGPGRQRIFEDARPWFLAEDSDDPLSFVRVCTALGPDARTLRAELVQHLRVRPAEDSADGS